MDSGLLEDMQKEEEKLGNLTRDKGYWKSPDL